MLYISLEGGDFSCVLEFFNARAFFSCSVILLADCYCLLICLKNNSR